VLGVGSFQRGNHRCPRGPMLGVKVIDIHAVIQLSEDLP
jgi:hypothetical protein